MDLIFAWVASISSGIEPLIVKASSRSLVKNPWLFNFLWVAFGIPLAVAFALFKGGGWPVNWWPIIYMALCSAAFLAFYTYSLYKIDVSTMAPLFSLRTVAAVLLGVWLLHEKLTGLDVALVTLIILMSPLASFDEHLKLRAFWQKHTLLAVLAMIVLALDGYFTNRSAHINGYASTLLWQDVLTLVLLLPTLKYAGLGEEPFTRKKVLPFIILGLCGFGYTASVVAAYGHNLALSSVIVSLPLSMLFAVALSKKYGHILERHPPKVYVVRFSAAAVMVGSAILLSIK